MPLGSLVLQLVTAVEEENEGGRMTQETRKVGKIPLWTQQSQINLVESCWGSNLSDGKQNVIPYVNNLRTTRSSERYGPPTRTWSLLKMRQMWMLETAWLITRCYYPSWKYSRGSLAHYTLLGMLDVSSLCTRIAAEQSVASTKSSPLQSPPRRKSSPGLPPTQCDTGQARSPVLQKLNGSETNQFEARKVYDDDDYYNDDDIFVNCNWVNTRWQ